MLARATLAQRGIAFKGYPFLKQDERGIWQAPSGTQVAWFKDPQGHVLSLEQNPMARKKRSRR